MKTVVLILGSGHCGSTLLDLILSSNEQAFGVGELVSLHQTKAYFTGEKPVSNIHGFNDSFWTREFTKEISPLFNEKKFTQKLINRLLPTWSQNRVRIYRKLLTRSGAKFLIDSSKHPWWVKRSLQQLQNQKELAAFLIFIKRHPAGVVNSYFRKYPERGFEHILNDHKLKMTRMTTFFESYPGSKAMVSYEELASDPAATIEELTGLLGMQYSSGMLEFWSHQHHHVSGNAGTKSFILKFQQGDRQAVLENTKTAYYGEHQLGIRLDERWKNELTEPQIRWIRELFELSE